MKKLYFYGVLVVCLLISKVSAEELTWGSCTTYAPMPVLFIHGINANMLTWEESIPKLKQYFGYREKKFNSEESIVTDPKIPKGGGVTWFEYPNGEKSPAKLYLETFDYGGEDRSGSIKPIKSNYPELDKKVEEILKAYYGDNWKKDGGKLIIVGHSQGGLLGRYYLQQNNADKVKRFITIGTPHTGSILAPFAWTTLYVPFNPLNSPYNYVLTGVVYGGLLSKYKWNLFKAQLKSMITLKGAPCDLVPWSKFIKEVNTTDMPPGIEYIAIVGKAQKRVYDEEKDKWVIVPNNYIDSDTVVSEKSQRSEYKAHWWSQPEQTIPWDEVITIADGNKGEHGQSPNQHDKILQSLDGIPDKGTKTYDTPCVTLGTSTVTPGTYSLYYLGSKENFYITGKIQDYLAGSCSISVEINSAGNYAYDENGSIRDRQDLIKPINMNTESQELPKGTKLNANFNFQISNLLSPGAHRFRLTVKNPTGLIGTSTTKEGYDWIPFEIVGVPVVEVPVQMTASPATPVSGGFQAASSLYFWDNQNNYWERWINSNLRVDSDNIIRYNAGTSNLDNPNLR
ncbi:MAG: alpha/beta fold hydrolase, partial [bacterium]